MEKENTILTRTRSELTACGLDAYVLLHMDAHQSEYLAPCDERIAFLSGFKGSNAICVVTQTHALMWTDGRYYLAAEKELHHGWEMKKMERGQTTYFEWIKENVPKGSKVGVDNNQVGSQNFKNR